MRNTTQPFFSILMTSTNHEPFNADVEKINADLPGDWCDDYINTVHYTDKCLGKFLDDLKKQPWYDHTLVAIVADHAHSCPQKHEYNSASRHHIPFLLLGGALRNEFRGITNECIASQVDFPAMILSQLHLKHNHFHWSKNVFNPLIPSFAFYAFDEGFGIVTKHHKVVYDHKLKKKIFASPADSESDSIIVSGKAYLQKVINDYMNLSVRH